MFRLNFTTRVMGEKAAGRLKNKEITQTIRSEKSDIVLAMLHRELLIGDQMEIALDGEVLGQAYPASIDRLSADLFSIGDATRGGFDTLEEMDKALKRAGYRFHSFNKYLFYRGLFTWLK